MSKELDIKSSTINKGIDLIKDFVDKLIGPTIEEVGLLMSDKIKYYRIINQIKILQKAKEYVEKNKIDVKLIPTKILVPLLENASLEESEEIQGKWSNMIGNLADSEQNLQNQIFPYLLTQISMSEYNSLLSLNEKEEGYSKRKSKESDLRREIKYPYSDQVFKSLRVETKNVEQNGFYIPFLEEFELANLKRLGLISQVPPRIIIDEFKTGDPDYGGEEEWHQIEAEYETGENGFRITELGVKFLVICEEKTN